MRAAAALGTGKPPRERNLPDRKSLAWKITPITREDFLPRVPPGRAGRSGVHRQRRAPGEAGQRRALYQLIEVLVQAQAFRGRHGVQVGLRLTELPQARLVSVQLTLGETLAHGDRAQHDRA